MVSLRQRQAAKRNIRKAQKKWRSMSHKEHAMAQPQGSARKKPGTTGKGNFYRIVVRPKSEFVSFKNHDVGKKGHIERISGRRKSGSWDTQAWLISKADAKKSGNTLVGISEDAKQVIRSLSSKPKKVKGDVFEAHPRKNVPEKSKPTKAMRTAQKQNIKKAQKARWK